MNPSNIFVVDDHPLIRKGLCDAINAEADMHVCGESGGYHETLVHLQTGPLPDVLVLDLNLKDGDGWNLLQQNHRRTPRYQP
ncbi:MAG: response regulator transcription factor [Spartobacteria bacterium]|nr:response regulator transcription factor [Spartobacteria bacterium]